MSEESCSVLRRSFAVKREYLILTDVVNVCFRQLVVKNSDYSGKLKFFGRIDFDALC